MSPFQPVINTVSEQEDGNNCNEEASGSKLLTLMSTVTLCAVLLALQ